MDDQLKLPIRYVSYHCRTQAGGPVRLIESTDYLNLKVNVGLTDADFDPKQQSATNFTRNEAVTFAASVQAGRIVRPMHCLMLPRGAPPRSLLSTGESETSEESSEIPLTA